MAWKTNEEYFKRIIEIGRKAFGDGNDAFASLLVDEDGEILLEHTNTATSDNDVTAHDTIMLVRSAVKKYSPEKLKTCTVFALLEPCVMCVASMYWAGLTKLRYAFDEAEYGEMRGGNGLQLHSRDFAEKSNREFDILGPFPSVRDEVLELINEIIERKNLE